MPATTPTTGTLLINSVVAAVLGSTLMVLVHELAHFFTGAAFGHRSILFAFGVSQVGAGVRDQAIIALAGLVGVAGLFGVARLWRVWSRWSSWSG